MPNNSDRRNSLNNGNYSEETPRVEADLLDTWDFIANQSLEKADSFLQKIENKLKILAENPGLGRKRDELVPGLRSFLVGSYLIFYYPINQGIEVIRVLHGARDIPSFFEDSLEDDCLRSKIIRIGIFF